MKGSYALNDMQKEILTSDAFAADGALTLKVSKEAGIPRNTLYDAALQSGS